MDQEIVTSVCGAVLVGIGATLVMDIWALLQKRAFGIASLDYRLVGRWIGYFPKGKFAHEAIGKAGPLHGEALLGWGAHYCQSASDKDPLSASNRDPSFGFELVRRSRAGQGCGAVADQRVHRS